MARDRVGSDIALQGNLDPAILLSAPETIQSETTRILETMKGNSEKFIFNLGHGIIKETATGECYSLLIETIRAFRSVVSYNMSEPKKIVITGGGPRRTRHRLLISSKSAENETTLSKSRS